jgi:hypothetical protein
MNARRYHAIEADVPYLCLYDLESPDVLRTAAYERNFREPEHPHWADLRRNITGSSTRRIYWQREETGPLPTGLARGLWMATLNVSETERPYVESWLDNTYLPGLAAADGVLRVRSFSNVYGGPDYMALADFLLASAFANSSFLRTAIHFLDAGISAGDTESTVGTYRLIATSTERYSPGDRPVDWDSVDSESAWGA